MSGTVLAAAWIAAAGCLGNGVFRCQDSGQCGDDGVCETGGFCSLPDVHCDSGRRYRAYAPEAIANRCVGLACPGNPVMRVRAGGEHACLVRQQDGSVACWGGNAYAELADADQISRSTMATVDGLPGPAIDVAVGDHHTCALLADFTVWCWGSNDSGQLGDGTTISRAQPTAVPGIDNARAIAAGGGFSCALRTAHQVDPGVARQSYTVDELYKLDTIEPGDNPGQVVCWGANSHGQLGRGASGGDSPIPQAVTAIRDARLLSASHRHACALDQAQGLFCWGANSQGELGDGTRVDRPDPTPVVGIDPGAAPITALASGVAHSCAVTGGQIICWGTNQLGELGDGSEDSRAQPTVVSLLSAVSDIAAAGHHTCARQYDGTAWCWGANQFGQLGEGTTTNIGVPVPVTGLREVESVATGNGFSCALRRDGTVWCWGDDRLGQLGNGSAVVRDVPAVVVGVAGASRVTAGRGHTCALQFAGASGGGGPGVTSAIQCWGANQAGQLGDGTRVDRGKPALLKIGLDANDIVSGALHSCTRVGDDGVWCWGRGSSGQLGTSMTIDYVVPVRAVNVTAVSRPGAGGAHTCAVGTQGAACWGENDEGQLGDGTRERRAGAVAVSGLADTVAQWALGAKHTCARLSSGHVACWGRGSEGQLGDGLMTGSASAVDVVGLEEVVSLAAGDNHTCAVTVAGAVLCWGLGAEGQLGWGSTGNRPIPAVVMGIEGEAVEVTAGSVHTCARRSPKRDPQIPGSVTCWGDNRFAQLGDGARKRQLKSTGVSVVADSLAVAAGGFHTCSVRTDRTVQCWGHDATGQLGSGRTLQFPTPQPSRLLCP